MESIIIKNIKSDIHKTLEEYELMGLTFTHAKYIILSHYNHLAEAFNGINNEYDIELDWYVEYYATFLQILGNLNENQYRGRALLED